MDKLKPYLLPGAALLLALALAFLWNLNHRARVSAEREAEEYKLRLKGQIVAAEESRAVLQADIEGLLRHNAALLKAVEETKAAAPGARPVAAAELSTDPVHVTAPLPPAATPPTSPAAPARDPASCALWDQDEISVGVKAVLLSTPEGNYLVSGVADLFREKPEPKALLGEGPFKAALSDLQAVGTPAEPRWGAFVMGLCGASGCAPGVGVLLPPWRVLGVRLEGSAALYGGAQYGALGTLGVRW